MMRELAEMFIDSGSVRLPADLVVGPDAVGVVVFAHGTGSSRFSPRNRAVAEALRAGGRCGTLLFDLLTEEEERAYSTRFDIDLLTARLLSAIEWLGRQPTARGLPVGLFGASTGAAAALNAAAELGALVRAVVSRGGRPDLALQALPRVTAPTLLIVGGLDTQVIELNRRALAALTVAQRDIKIVPGATHLFEEPGALESVVELTLDWFERYLR